MFAVLAFLACADLDPAREAVSDSEPFWGPSCADGLDGDGDGFTDAADPDCAYSTSEETTWDGPVVGLDLDFGVVDGGWEFAWWADEGWASSLTLTLEGDGYAEVHAWDPADPVLFLSYGGEAVDGEVTRFGPGAVPLDRWSLCADHPLADGPVCVEGLD